MQETNDKNGEQTRGVYRKSLFCQRSVGLDKTFPYESATVSATAELLVFLFMTFAITAYTMS